ncbi:MAG: hypothetical protein V7605_909 [Acidimicrobiaceae bacterium]
MDDTSTAQDDQDRDERADEDTPDEPAGATDGGATDDARLDELGDRIQSARSEAEEAVDGVAEPADESPGGGEGADGGSKETFAESGDSESKAEDDQTIAPPG